MDPNKVLAQMRATVEVMQSDGCTRDVRATLAGDLAFQFRALDGWLSRGGTPPEEWREGPDAVGEDRQGLDADDDVCVCCKGRPGIILRLGDWVCGACESYLGTHPGGAPARVNVLDRPHAFLASGRDGWCDCGRMEPSVLHTR